MTVAHGMLAICGHVVSVESRIIGEEKPRYLTDTGVALFLGWIAYYAMHHFGAV